jgi:hypothetical protein
MQKLIPALLFAIMALVSCSKSDDQAKTQNDSWYVFYYESTNIATPVPQDKTSLFAGYTFEFNDNNEWVINAPSGTITTAQWGEESSTTITFKMTAPFAPVDELLGSWEIVEQTTENLELTQLSAPTTVDAVNKKVIFKKQ